MTTDRQRIAEETAKERQKLWNEIGNFLDRLTVKSGRSGDELNLWIYCSQALDGWRDSVRAHSDQGWVSVSPEVKVLLKAAVILTRKQVTELRDALNEWLKLAVKNV